MKKRITFIGSGEDRPGSPIYSLMQEAGRLVAEQGVVVVTGAYGGAMEAAVRGARRACGEVIAFALTSKPVCALLETREVRSWNNLPLEVQFGLRLGNLLSSGGFIMGASGRTGTMVEFLSFVNLASKFWTDPKRLSILRTEETLPDVLQFLLDSPLLAGIKDRIKVTDNSAEAVVWVLSS